MKEAGVPDVFQTYHDEMCTQFDFIHPEIGHELCNSHCLFNEI